MNDWPCFYSLKFSPQGPWPGSSVRWSIIPLCQGCGFDLWPGHIQEAMNECISKWHNKSIVFSLSLSLKSVVKKKSVRREKIKLVSLKMFIRDLNDTQIVISIYAIRVYCPLKCDGLWRHFNHVILQLQAKFILANSTEFGSF